MSNLKELKNQIKKLEKEITSLEEEAIRPEVIKNSTRFKRVSQQLSKNKKELIVITDILKTTTQLKEAKKILKKEKDPDMISLVEEEIKHLEEKQQKMDIQLNQIRSGEQVQHIKSCIAEIRAGTGGDEAALFAADLFRMYSRFAENKNWKTSIVSSNQTGTGGFKEVIAQIDGDNVFDILQFENGVHRVQRIPITESSGRIHTSAASVVIYPLFESPKIDINHQDLKIDVYRSSGPGGQSVNTTDSAVRVTHIPTGLIASCQDEKSQHKNRSKAISMLKSRLLDLEKEKEQDKLSQIRKTAIKTGDRSAKVRTYNFPQNRVTDHRIKKSWYNLKSVMDGYIDQIIEALKTSA